MLAWYAVYTKARIENWARSNLWERNFEVYLPQYRKQRRHARKKDWVAVPLFPRYLFVRADLEVGDGRRIANTSGVSHLIGLGDNATPIRDTIISDIRDREDETGHIRLCDPSTLIPGDTVCIHSGAMRETSGIFSSTSDNDRVMILLNLMGRTIRTAVPSKHITKII